MPFMQSPASWRGLEGRLLGVGRVLGGDEPKVVAQPEARRLDVALEAIKVDIADAKALGVAIGPLKVVLRLEGGRGGYSEASQHSANERRINR